MKKQTIISVIFMVLFTSYSFAICYEGTENNTPTNRYQLDPDGWVIDKKTNLMWMQCAYGQTLVNETCVDEQTMTFESALMTANDFEFAGYSDWRLPNIKELISIVSNHCNRPAINLEVFPGTDGSISNPYWSATKTENNSYAWHLDIADGSARTGTKNAFYQIRLVRDLTTD